MQKPGRSSTVPRVKARTVLDVLNATTDFFKKHGVESARLNAEQLAAQVLGKKRIELYLEFDRPLDERELAPLRELVKRRAAGEPLQHLLGTVEFCGQTFLCDKRALIPRPETEQLVEEVSEDLLSRFPRAREGGSGTQELRKEWRLADVGTGSGVIALSLAAKFPAARVDAVDVSPEALALARQNAERLALAGRVRFFESDLFAVVDGRYDVIVANLPYIDRGVVPTLAREVQHDPALALDGGPDGAEILRRFAVEAREHLSAGGQVALEMGGGHAEPMRAHFAGLGYEQIRCTPDYQGVNRFLFATYG